MPADQNMNEFFADQGSLIAYSTKDAPPPYDSKLQRAEPATNMWRTVYQTDARFMQMQVAAGRIGLLEYREPLQGAGAFSVKIMVVDLTTGVLSAIDSYAMSAATYRGGGGAPRRPGFGLALSSDRIAWTQLIEGPGGSVTGELRMASLADPGRATVIGSSTEWIRPLGLDSHHLLYVIGGKAEDQLHVRDLDTGADRIVLTAPVGNQQLEGGVPRFNDATLVGDRAIWIDSPRGATGQMRALNVATGASRTIDADGSVCARPTAGTRYVAWYCSASTFTILDAMTLAPVRDAPAAIVVGLMSRDDGLVWFSRPPAVRQATFFRPR